MESSFKAAYHYLEQQAKEYWPELSKPVAASAAIVFPFREFMVKSRLQTNTTYHDITWSAGLKGGLQATKSAGPLVGAQTVIKEKLETNLKKKTELGDKAIAVASAVTVGFFSTPFVAVFNGHSMGWKWHQSLKKLNARQFAATTLQESGFVAGVTAAGKVSEVMKEHLGDYKVLDLAAAYVSGAAGSLAGHPGNTYITRDQANMKTAFTFQQLTLGAARRANGAGVFTVLYTLAKKFLNPNQEE